MESISYDIDHHSPFYYKDITRYLIELCINSDIERDIIQLGSTCKSFHLLYKEARVIVISKLRDRFYLSLSNNEIIQGIISSVEIDALPYNFNICFKINNKYIKRYVLCILHNRFEAYKYSMKYHDVTSSNLHNQEFHTIIRKKGSYNDYSGRKIIMNGVNNALYGLSELMRNLTTDNSYNIPKYGYDIINPYEVSDNVLNVSIEVLNDGIKNKNVPIVVPPNNYRRCNTNGIRRINIISEAQINKNIRNQEGCKQIFIQYLQSDITLLKLKKVLYLIKEYVDIDNMNTILQYHIYKNHIDIVSLLLTIYKGNIYNIINIMPSMKMLSILQAFLEITNGEVSYDKYYTNILSKVTEVNTYLLIPYTSIYFNEVLRDE